MNSVETLTANQHFITLPAITLPNGIATPWFQVGQYLCGEDSGGKVSIAPMSRPGRISIPANHSGPCVTIGGKLITELELLAIAYDISQQDINWSSGKVGDGYVFRGLHMDTVGDAQIGGGSSNPGELPT